MLSANLGPYHPDELEARDVWRVVPVAVLDHRAHHIISTLAREAGTERAANAYIAKPYAVAARTAGRCLGV